MSAGTSAAHQAEHQRLLALEFARLAEVSKQIAGNFAAAATSERRLAEALAPLQSEGYWVLADRRWPGSRRAQVDFVVVGPGGVFIVDAKNWREVQIERTAHASDARIFRGDADVTEEFEGLADLGVKTESSLAELGLAPGEVHTLAAFTNRSNLSASVMGVKLMGEAQAAKHILRQGRRLTAAQVEKVLVAVIALFPPYDIDTAALSVTVRVPLIDDVEVGPRAGLRASQAERADTVVGTAQRAPEPEKRTEPALLTVEEVHEAMWQSLHAAPIEEWMAFLAPEQARLVRRSFNGPSRIRGAAGTGKTVVGLHRAAYIARSRPGKVLVTTFVRTLPDVLASLLERMAPEIVDRVEFTGVHAFAIKLLKDRGILYTLDGRAADRAWADVWRTRGKEGPLGRVDAESDYWKEEVISVIKGRGLVALSQYENCARTGRRRRLTLDQRKAVWELYDAYEAELSERGVWDFADVINAADASLAETPLEGYSAVVIDEAQDLSCAMIRMLHRLVGDAPDGLNLIGDGQQTIYPGGYTLSEIGISIAGRGVVMNRNYRNTVEIAEFAAALVRDDSFEDIEGTVASADAAEIVRRGDRPKIARFTSRAGHDASFVARVRELLAAPGARAGDIGVLAMTTYQVTDAIAALTAAGIPTVNLLEYDGRDVDAVKVGTIKRAKGLEFKQVLVVRAPVELLDATAATPADSPAAERAALTRRELYVAMTRARDGLWVGVA